MEDKRLDIAQKAILQSGDYLISKLPHDHTLKIKSDGSTQLREDVESENIIIETIKAAFHDDTFITEESDPQAQGEYKWIIDPLCGTLSYYRGVETWSISIALVYQNSYVFGLVYQPVLKNLFIGVTGQGATCNNQQITLSKTDALKNAFVSVEHNVFIDGKIDILRLIADIKRIRVGHGSGGELAYVAAGHLDCVIKTGQSCEHYSGGRAILESVGGVFMDFSGSKIPVHKNKSEKIDYIATNAKLIDQFLPFVER